MKPAKVLLLELNEISWTVIDSLVAERGKEYLPNLIRLRERGTWGCPLALENPPFLDPWITWVSLHTGMPQEAHGARVLEQDLNTIRVKRTWEYALDAGKSVGVYGSIGAYPPKSVVGFIVPGPFAPGNETFPASLQPVQELNRRHTQVHGGSVRDPTLMSMVRPALSLLNLGLRLSTCVRIAIQLIRERLYPHAKWRRVILQPLINYDFFAHIYKRQRPDFATWHSNHAAHYMHHYWRAWSNKGFLVSGPKDEKSKFGEAVPLGYRICDELIGRFLRLVDDSTVLLVCSSMGQQPYVNATYGEGKVIVRIRDIGRFAGLFPEAGITEVVPTMVPQVNLRVPSADARRALKERIAGIRRCYEGVEEAAIAADENGELLTITPLGLAERRRGVVYRIPGLAKEFQLEELFAMDAPTVKQGMHHPEGVFVAVGPGVPAGKRLGPCCNLDIAPTILSLLGLSAPKAMTGRSLIA